MKTLVLAILLCLFASCAYPPRSEHYSENPITVDTTKSKQLDTLAVHIHNPEKPNTEVVEFTLGLIILYLIFFAPKK